MSVGQFEALVDRLFDLHEETDEDRRRELLTELVADDVEFFGVTARAIGVEEFNEVFRPLGDGARLVRTTAVDEHHGWLRNGWEVRLAGGSTAVGDDGIVYGGLQISQLTDDGRFRRLVPWRNMAPPDARSD